MPPELWIVGGPSSAGKSHFLATPQAAELTGLPPEAPVLFPSAITTEIEIQADSYLHYNLLRPAWKRQRNGEDPAAGADDFSADHKWRRIMRLPVRRSAVVITVDRDLVLARLRERTTVEPGKDRVYPGALWSELYERVDLDRIYDAFREELERQGIPYVEVRSEREGFSAIGTDR